MGSSAASTSLIRAREPASSPLATDSTTASSRTIDDTRASLPLEELVHDEDGRLALEALVRGRLLVVREDEHGSVYEIAHEALIRSWGNLRRWLGRVAGLVGVAVLLAWFLGAIDLVSGWVVAGASLALVLGWAAGERPWRLERH